MNNSLETVLEALLFFKGGACSVKELATATGKSTDEVTAALDTLTASLQGRGIRLVREGETVALATAPEVEELITTLRKEELEGPIGRAGLETLAVIIYRGPLSRADIEYVRGVNVSSTLRSLLIRGLIERVDNPKDKRSFLYQATTELPAYLGVSKLSDLPDFAQVTEELQSVLHERDAQPIPEEPAE
jgi:segregation and condensation protein B